MSRIGGVVAGIVKSREDPQSLGRVQVAFDWMDDAPQSYWARVAAPMAGGDRGAFFMPEENDEVLVAFDHGDVSHPYVIGYCWSDPDKPPFSADLQKRGIKTVSGHELIFDDKAHAITLTTAGGFLLKLDESGKTVELTTGGGVTVELDDTPPAVKISLPTGSQISLGPSGLQIDASAGTVEVQTTAATITAASLTLDSAIVNVTGVLNVTGPIITAASIVSPAYTPGAGNLI
jgi:phage baseplate assembly protein gpV